MNIIIITIFSKTRSISDKFFLKSTHTSFLDLAVSAEAFNPYFSYLLKKYYAAVTAQTPYSGINF